MPPSSTRSVRPLLAVLGPPERATLAASALTQSLERVAVVAAAASVALRGTHGAPVVALTLGAIFLARSGLTAGLRIRVRERLLESLTSSLLSDTRDLATPASEELAFALMDGLYASEEILGERLPQLAGDIAGSLILAIAIIVFVPARFVLEGALAMAVGAVVAVVARRVTAGSSERSWRAYVPVIEDFSSAIHGRIEILGNGNREPFRERMAAKLDAWRAEATAAGRTSFLAGRAPVVGAAVVVGLVLLADGRWAGGGLAQAAVLASAMPAFAGVARGVLELTRNLTRATPAIACLERGECGERDGPIAAQPAMSLSTVTWKGVSFTYPDATEPALVDADIVWSKGELLGLGGQNGSGKSTFVRLLLGLHEPTRGSVLVGDIPLAQIDRAAFRRSVGYLAQRPYLPDRMTVSDAIHLLAPDATPSAMQSMLTRLGLWTTLVRHAGVAVARTALSTALDVKIGTLSAGEKQRVGIARVLLREAPLLLLDEPDANLDAEGVALVGEILRKESKTRMVLVIAHSPALLACMTRVLHFDAGRVREA